MLSIGSKAPDFKLKLDTGEIFHLRDYYGKRSVVISFLTDNFIETETHDAYVFFQHLQTAHTLGAVVIAIKPKNIDELRKILTQNNFTIMVASDPTLEVFRNYRTLWLRGLALRKITYVIDKSGIIRGCLSHHLLTEKSWDKIIRLLKELHTDPKMKNSV